MAARASMVELIARLRGMIHDPSGANATFSDDDLQGFLDDNRTDANYLELEPRVSYAPGGAVSYLVYATNVGDWETTAAIVDSNYAAVVASVSDYRRGTWTFAASREPPLFVSGSHYNLNLAAVDALEQWMAKVKFAYDFTADGATFKRSQQLSSMAALIARYQEADAQATGLQVMTMTRPDVIC